MSFVNRYNGFLTAFSKFNKKELGWSFHDQFRSLKHSCLPCDSLKSFIFFLSLFLTYMRKEALKVRLFSFNDSKRYEDKLIKRLKSLTNFQNKKQGKFSENIS